MAPSPRAPVRCTEQSVRTHVQGDTENSLKSGQLPARHRSLLEVLGGWCWDLLHRHPSALLPTRCPQQPPPLGVATTVQNSMHINRNKVYGPQQSRDMCARCSRAAKDKCVCGAYKEARRTDGEYVLTPPCGPQPAQALRGGKHDSTETPLEDKGQGARLVLTQRSAVTMVTLKPRCNNVCDALGRTHI